MRHHSEKQGIPSCMLDFRGELYDSPHLTLARQICQELRLSPRHQTRLAAVGGLGSKMEVRNDEYSRNFGIAR
jgi:hypothetical protein